MNIIFDILEPTICFVHRWSEHKYADYGWTSPDLRLRSLEGRIDQSPPPPEGPVARGLEGSIARFFSKVVSYQILPFPPASLTHMSYPHVLYAQ